MLELLLGPFTPLIKEVIHVSLPFFGCQKLFTNKKKGKPVRIPSLAVELPVLTSFNYFQFLNVDQAGIDCSHGCTCRTDWSDPVFKNYGCEFKTH